MYVCMFHSISVTFNMPVSMLKTAFKTFKTVLLCSMRPCGLAILKKWGWGKIPEENKRIGFWRKRRVCKETGGKTERLRGPEVAVDGEGSGGLVLTISIYSVIRSPPGVRETEVQKLQSNFLKDLFLCTAVYWGTLVFINSHLWNSTVIHIVPFPFPSSCFPSCWPNPSYCFPL